MDDLDKQLSEANAQVEVLNKSIKESKKRLKATRRPTNKWIHVIGSGVCAAIIYYYMGA